MQPMSDALTVLGSRHGWFWEPNARRSYLVRAGLFPGLPIDFRAGLVVDGRTLWLPLTAEGDAFPFCDQDSSACTMKLTGLDPVTALKLELTATIPFRPRDVAFSTIPVIDLELRVKRLSTQFRWTSPAPIAGPVRIVLAVGSPAWERTETMADGLAWSFTADAFGDRMKPEPAWQVAQHDRLVVHAGRVADGRIVAEAPVGALHEARIHASWCTWSEPLLTVHDRPAPFKYTERFADLAAVVAWAKANPEAIRDNARRVDGLLASHNLSRGTANLTALTLHAWLINTWYVIGPDRDWFTVWEGDCYYHSTVDVEYTQTPFYLAVWPELLGLELDEWPEFVVPGERIVGDRAAGTVVFMHDIGQMSQIDTTRYNHPMPVEENTNYVLMSYAYWRRTGDDSRLKRHAATIAKALEFVLACDTTGNGVPDLGTANTIDDASPAVQFGKEQVYLAVKAMAALVTGAEMLAQAGDTSRNAAWLATAARIAGVLREKGWQDDHFVTLLDNSAAGVTNSWTGETFRDGTIPGWDAAHIYTTNGIALLDMLGRQVDLDEERLRLDLQVATERCLDKYGCRHSDYEGDMPIATMGEGGSAARATCRIGWISMNLMRDMAALYRGVDLRALMDRYWEYQVLVNTQGPHLFFETFNGNNLMTYPRGIVVWGYYEAVGGVRLDVVDRRLSVAPFDEQVRVPLLFLADWERGVAPLIANGRLHDPEGLAAGYLPG